MHVLCVILCMLMLDEAVPFKPLRYSVLLLSSRLPLCLMFSSCRSCKSRHENVCFL